MHFRWYFLILCSIKLLCTPVQSNALDIGIRNDVYDPVMLRAADRVKQAAKNIGLEIAYRQLPAKRSLKLADIGLLDGEFYRHTFIEKNHPNLIRVNVPLGQFDYYIWMLAGQECVNQVEQLAQLKPVGVRGVIFFSAKVYPLSEVSHAEVNTMSQVLEILTRRRADYTVHNNLVIRRYSQLTDVKMMRCLDEPLFSMKFYLYLHKSKRDLIPYLEQALRAENIQP